MENNTGLELSGLDGKIAGLEGKTLVLYWETSGLDGKIAGLERETSCLEEETIRH